VEHPYDLESNEKADDENENEEDEKLGLNRKQSLVKRNQKNQFRIALGLEIDDALISEEIT
jgi:hypothetical protein